MTGWLLFAAAGACVVVAALWCVLATRRVRVDDLGPVSAQWLAEHSK